jgi:hypothetical protein
MRRILAPHCFAAPRIEALHARQKRAAASAEAEGALLQARQIFENSDEWDRTRHGFYPQLANDADNPAVIFTLRQRWLLFSIS